MPDPEVMEMIAAAVRQWKMPELREGVQLVEYPAGDCADCRKPFDVLYSVGYGSVGLLCAKCQDARLRVAARVEASGPVRGFTQEEWERARAEAAAGGALTQEVAT